MVTRCRIVPQNGDLWWTQRKKAKFSKRLKGQTQTMFEGMHSHNIDPKGRLIVPVKFREKLGDEFFVTAGLDGCLIIYAQKEWKAFEEKLSALPAMTNPAARKLQRFFLANAARCECDKQGRIIVPQHLRELGGIENEVVFTGLGSRIELWSRSRWLEAGTYEDINQIASSMADLGISL